MPSVGNFHLACLRGDGTVFATHLSTGVPPRLGGCVNVPPLDTGTWYTQVAAGAWFTLLLRSDGEVVACGLDLGTDGFIIPRPEDTWYTQCSIAVFHSALLRSDGEVAVFICDDGVDGLIIPLLKPGVTYTQVSCGTYTIVLLRSDGTAIACGENRSGQCDIPELPDKVCYTQVAAGTWHTVLLRSDGQVVVSGCGTPVA